MEQKQQDLGTTKWTGRKDDTQTENKRSMLWLRWLIAAVFFLLIVLLLITLIKCGNKPVSVDEQPIDIEEGQPVVVEEDEDDDIFLSCPDNNHPHLIDLGLPSGTLWSCCNVGARSPEGFGGYYAWGETVEKSDYQWSTYAYYNSNANTPIEETVIIGYDISGTEYDAATVNWGDQWKMPSSAQCNELVNSCYVSWTTQNGVRGQIVKSTNGGSIFLPAAGWRHHAVVDSMGTKGGYWSSTCHKSNPSYSTRLVLRDTLTVRGLLRYFGQPIRPVSATRTKEK